MLTDYDLHLLGEGRHWKSYEKLGAQLHVAEGVAGANFSVWAPNAEAVSIVGDFNGWDDKRHAMQKRIPSGIWELFVPGIGAGTLYKYRVKADGSVSDRADPYGFGAEVPPRTASKVVDLASYSWRDEEWMAQRAARNSLSAPMSIYEVHLGSWRRPGNTPHRWLSYAEIERELVPYCLEMGFTHVEFLPPSEHPLSASWGYQTIGLFAATSRFGSPEDLMALIDALHRAVAAPADDFRAGFDGVLAGVLVAEGQAGLDSLDRRGLFGREARALDQRHLLAAVRFAGESLTETIPRERIVAATAALLASPAVAADATVDLARYQAWEAVADVSRLWDTLGTDDPLIRRAVAGYLAACPLPAARQELERIGRQNPGMLKQALDAAALPAAR